MTLSPKLVGPAIGLLTGLITSTSMTFIGLAVNYGFQPDFVARWLKSAAFSYVIAVPLLMIVIPPIQRFVMRQAGLPTPQQIARRTS
jgi:Protein of unknown function (DUF2798)